MRSDRPACRNTSTMVCRYVTAENNDIHMKGHLLFEEQQKFTFTWSWWVMLLVSVPFIGGILYAFYYQLILGKTWGDKPLSDSGLILTGMIMLVLMVGVIVLFQMITLRVWIDERTLHYSFYPFVGTRTLEKGELKELTVRKYHPILDYGGWGYRMRWRRGKAFTVSGRWGLQLEFPSGKKLLLGTQKPKELGAAILQLKTNWRM